MGLAAIPLPFGLRRLGTGLARCTFATSSGSLVGALRGEGLEGLCVGGQHHVTLQGLRKVIYEILGEQKIII